MKLSKANAIMMLVLMCVIAAGAGTYGAVRQTVKELQGNTYAHLTVPRSTTQPVQDRVNASVSGIRDERTYPTEPQTTVNLPYSGSFALPVGSDITKDYSGGEMVYSETMGDWRVHSGVDFGASAGNDVLSVGEGTVTSVYTDSFWGTVMEIDHGSGMTVKYCGLQKNTAVKQGAAVSKFEKIGTLGHIPVELSEGDHLHIEVTVDGVNVDPLKALNKTGLR